MKRQVLLALALVAGASLFTAGAARKKDVRRVVVQPVVLASGSDTLSYVAGMSLTNGLIPFLVQQQGVDTAYMADFIRGFKEVVRAGSDPRMKAYVAGLDIATQINQRMLPNLTKDFSDTPDSIITERLYRGFTDALEGDTTVFSQAEAEKIFREKQTAMQAIREEKLYGENRRAGESFLAQNAKEEGVITLPSGLQYKVMKEGHGAIPKEDDRVLVNYEGRLLDGTIFDASARHGDKPSEFRPNQVIPGWTEALTMMPVGSRWRLFIPYQLAYGNREAGSIKPYSMLIFDLELVGVEKREE